MLARLVLNSTSGDPPASTSQNAGITGMSHRAWPKDQILKYDFGSIGEGRAKERGDRPGTVAHTCNPSTLGG